MTLLPRLNLSKRAVEETLAYYAFPEEHWRRIRTTDAFDKRLLRQIMI
jgi:hypothetical protein